jgi:hypothetical protein
LELSWNALSDFIQVNGFLDPICNGRVLKYQDITGDEAGEKLTSQVGKKKNNGGWVWL